MWVRCRREHAPVASRSIERFIQIKFGRNKSSRLSCFRLSRPEIFNETQLVAFDADRVKMSVWWIYGVEASQLSGPPFRLIRRLFEEQVEF